MKLGLSAWRIARVGLAVVGSIAACSASKSTGGLGGDGRVDLGSGSGAGNGSSASGDDDGGGGSSGSAASSSGVFAMGANGGSSASNPDRLLLISRRGVRVVDPEGRV